MDTRPEWYTPAGDHRATLIHDAGAVGKIGVRRFNLQAAGVREKITFTTMPFYQADSPLVPSGLLGEVSIIRLDGGR